MNLTKMKSAAEMKIPGCRVEFVQEQGSLTEVIIVPEGTEGYSVKMNSYSMHAYLRSSFEEAEEGPAGRRQDLLQR